MIGYKIIAEAVNKTEEQVRSDAKDSLFSLESIPSMIAYIARGMGWVPPEEVAGYTQEAHAALLAQRAAAKTLPVEAAKPAVAPVPAPVVRKGVWSVESAPSPSASGDPYLARVREQR